MITGASGADTHLEDEAAEMFVQATYGEWGAAEQRALEARLRADAAFAQAYARVAEASGTLDRQASHPALQVLADAAPAAHAAPKPAPTDRRPRFALAAAAGVVLAVATAWQLSPYGYRPGYIGTGIGEQRMVELPDRSRVALDSATRLRVRYTREARTVELIEGQAQFVVAHDPARPFQVQAGDRSVVALGTVFTVEYVDKRIQVALLEGKVAVKPHRQGAEAVPVPTPEATPAAIAALPSQALGVSAGPGAPAKQPSLPSRSTVELVAGQALRIAADDRPVLIAHADLQAVTAWRQGKVVFRSEPLGAAARRMNRYSRLRIDLEDDALAGREFSGVFDVGDTDGFVAAVGRYLPVTIDRSNPDVVVLRRR